MKSVRYGGHLSCACCKKKKIRLSDKFFDNISPSYLVPCGFEKVMAALVCCKEGSDLAQFHGTVFGFFGSFTDFTFFSDFQLFRSEYHWRDFISRNMHLVHQNWCRISFTFNDSQMTKPLSQRNGCHVCSKVITASMWTFLFLLTSNNVVSIWMKYSH
jgi:hypothetical protein